MTSHAVGWRGVSAGLIQVCPGWISGRERRAVSRFFFFRSGIAISRTSPAGRLFSVCSSVASELGAAFVLRGIMGEDTLPLVDGELGGLGVDKKMRTY